MSTLLDRSNYEKVRRARDFLAAQLGPEMISGIHMPWAGDRLIKPSDKERSIYFVGSATDKKYALNVPQNYEASLENLESEFREHSMERANTPFWRFLSGLTKHFYGRPHYDCVDRWGWSNLFKIGFNEGEEDGWPRPLFEMQSAACVVALTSEFQQLRNSLVFIGSGSKLAPRMLKGALPNAIFDSKYENDGIYHWLDNSASNLYVWGYHPGGALRQKIFDRMLDRTISLAGR